MNGSLATLLNFALKNEWPFGCSFKILHFSVKNERPFGYNCKISYFAVKKRMAAWVHALRMLLLLLFKPLPWHIQIIGQ